MRLNIFSYVLKVKSLSHIQLFVTPWTVAYQAPLSMGLSRQEYWSGLPFPSPGNLPNPGIEPRSPALRADALLSEPPGKPKTSLNSLKLKTIVCVLSMCVDLRVCVHSDTPSLMWKEVKIFKMNLYEYPVHHGKFYFQKASLNYMFWITLSFWFGSKTALSLSRCFQVVLKQRKQHSVLER